MASQQIFFLLLSSPIRHGLPGACYSRLESLEQLSVIKEVTWCNDVLHLHSEGKMGEIELKTVHSFKMQYTP